MIEATRDLIKRNPALASQRNEVARAAGVTPALICYHFPDHMALMHLAMGPVIERYMRELLDLLAGSYDAETTFRAIIHLFMRVHREEPHLVDTYIDCVQREADLARTNEMLSAYRALTTFLTSSGLVSPSTGGNADFTAIAIWATCRSMAERPKLPDVVVVDSTRDSEETQMVQLVLQLFAATTQKVSAGNDESRECGDPAKSSSQLVSS